MPRNNTTANKRFKYIQGGAILFPIAALLIGLFAPCSGYKFFSFTTLSSLAIACWIAVLPGRMMVNATYNLEATWRVVIRAGSAAAGLVLVFLFFFILAPQLFKSITDCKPHYNYLNYTISFRDDIGAVIDDLSGRVLIDFDSRPDEKFINGSEVTFSGVTASDLENKVKIELKADGWVFKSTKSKVIDTVLGGHKIILNLVRDDKYCCISGKVLDSGTSAGLEDVTVEVGGVGRTKTDLEGEFSIPIENDRWKDTLRLSVSKPGYLELVRDVSILVNRMQTIYLTRK